LTPQSSELPPLLLPDADPTLLPPDPEPPLLVLLLPEPDPLPLLPKPDPLLLLPEADPPLLAPSEPASAAPVAADLPPHPSSDSAKISPHAASPRLRDILRP
jgi:hypothetical protein